MQQNVHQFISALNSFKGKEEIDEKQLEKKCLECFTLVKILQKKKNLDDQEYELFRFFSTEIFLMCCPSVKENIKFDPNSEIYCIQEKLCTINETLVLHVLRTLKSCKYLRGIVCWLPFESNCALLNVLMGSDSFSPAMYIIFENLLYGILFSAQLQDHEPDSFGNVINEVGTFLQKLQGSINVEVEIKNASFFIHCLTMSLTYLLNFISSENLEVHSQMGNFFEARKMSGSFHKHRKQKESAIHLAEVIFQICDSFAENISCNTFIEWESIKTNLFDFPQSFLLTGLRQRNPSDNIQKHMGCNSYIILQFLHSTDFPISCVNKFEKYKSLLHEIATMPEDRSSPPLSLENLSSEHDASFNDQIIEFILQNKESFSSSKCLSILQRNIRFYDINTVKVFLKNSIELSLLGELNLSSEWKSIILDYAKLLPSEVLVQIIKEDLSYGSVAVLKQTDFLECMTKVFNQLDSSVNISTDFLHLALQSGVEVVSLMVDHAFGMPGLEHVLMRALKNLSCICFCTDDKGSSVAGLALKKLLPNVDSVERKNGFVNLSSKFLEMYENYSFTKEERILLAFPNEMLNHVVFPNIYCKSHSIPLECNAAVEIFTMLMDLFPSVVFQPRKEFSASFVTLTLIYNNFFCHSFNESIGMRDRIAHILEAMIQRMRLNQKAFSTQYVAINKMLRKADLHPRCCLLIYENTPGSPLVAPTYCDEVLCQLYKKELFTPEDILQLTGDKYKWSWALLQILPDADEREWIKALLATHCSIIRLLCYSKVIRTLDLFSAILLTACSEYTDLYPAVEVADRRKSLFARFSSAATIYILKVVADVAVEEQVVTVCNIGVWWCDRLALFATFDPELPTSLLGKLANELAQLVHKCGDGLRPSMAMVTNTNELSGGDDLRIDLSVERFAAALARIPSCALKSTTVRKLEVCLEACRQPKRRADSENQ